MDNIEPSKITGQQPPRPSAIVTGIFKVGFLVPRIRPAMWRFVYNFLASKDRDGKLLFMNFGYSDGDDSLRLKPEDEGFRYEIQLYAHTVGSIDLAGKDVLEVGCGRGGGGSFIVRYLKPKSYVGLDLAQEAIRWCQQKFPYDNARWVHGAAAAIPLGDASVDVVVNVESSHTYPSVPAFLAEVNRVLRPGGYLAFVDVRTPAGSKELEGMMEHAGLQRVEQHLITKPVLHALDRLTQSRLDQIQANVPRVLRHAFRDFTGVQDSAMYTQLRTGVREYYYYLVQKPPVTFQGSSKLS